MLKKGELLTWLGKPVEGEISLRMAMGLDPYSATMWVHLLGRSLLQQTRLFRCHRSLFD